MAQLTWAPGSTAALYDRETSGPIASRYRAISERMLLSDFKEGQRVLEVGCGTGVEAVMLASNGVRVVATDVMPEMVEATRYRARRTGVGGLVDARVLPASGLGGVSRELGEGAFDGAFSSFGALNCEEDLRPVSAALATMLRPGARFLLSIMNRACLWEMGLFMALLRPDKALRRLRPLRARIAGRPFEVRYYRTGDVMTAFDPWFGIVGLRGFALLPPPYLDTPFARLPGFLDLASRLDPPMLRALGDHLFMELERGTAPPPGTPRP